MLNAQNISPFPNFQLWKHSCKKYANVMRDRKANLRDRRVVSKVNSEEIFQF